MVDQQDFSDSTLLDWHLGYLEGDEADRLQAALQSSPELAARSRALGDLLALLDRSAAPRPPVGLADKVLAFIDHQTKVLPFAGAETPASMSTDGHTVGSRFSASWRDVLAVAACIALFVAVAVPGYRKAQDASRRYACFGNLKTICTAGLQYAQANNGYLPYADYVPGAVWSPAAAAPGAPVARNSRHIFRLARGEYLPTMRVFLCPVFRESRPMPMEIARQSQDFADPANVTYSFLFMNLPSGLRVEEARKRSRGLVLAADHSPLRPTASSLTGPLADPGGNSPCHEAGAGQNAVYADGGGGFFTDRRIGVDCDDIYGVGSGPGVYLGTEVPVSDTDSFLPPG
ncbi:MAG: hypothetical protein KA354_11180 [Phycisphaerae bacterium]|nr:hypothetical protein [Phycisphaerae bacterium]